jgi:hypothetical protein
MILACVLECSTIGSIIFLTIVFVTFRVLMGHHRSDTGQLEQASPTPAPHSGPSVPNTPAEG